MSAVSTTPAPAPAPGVSAADANTARLEAVLAKNLQTQAETAERDAAIMVANNMKSSADKVK